MGSLTSGPKAPSQQVVYVPAPETTTATQTTASTDTTTDSAQSAADARKKSLLERARGRYGTVLTGFRGFLSEADNSGKRKTLLGE